MTENTYFTDAQMASVYASIETAEDVCWALQTYGDCLSPDQYFDLCKLLAHLES